MEGNIRPTSLGAVADNQSFGSGIMKRANALRGLTSSGAQTNNTDNFITVSISCLKEFKNHPFNVREDEELDELAESIKANGILHPIIVRPIEDGYYEILAGHRRTKAAVKAGLQDIPAKVLNVDDDAAVIVMTDTNLRQREKILHSERAKAYKMQMDAYRCQGKRHDLIVAVQNEIDLCSNGTQADFDRASTLCSNGTRVKSRDIVAELNNTSALQITRYLRLNELIEPILELVDDEQIAFRAGVALSFLTKEEQIMIVDAIEEGIIKKIDLKLAEELKSISKSGELNRTVIEQMFSKKDNTVIPQNTFSLFQSATKKALKHFKKVDYQDVQIDSEELEQVIFQAIKNYAETRKGE